MHFDEEKMIKIIENCSGMTTCLEYVMKLLLHVYFIKNKI